MKFSYLLSVLIMDAYWLKIYANKRKNIEQAPIEYNETIAEYEKQHYNTYSTTALEGSEMKMPAEICEKYLRKIFPKRDLSLRSHYIIEGVVRYNYVQAAVTMATVACELSKPVNSRLYFHFIRAPHPGCMYLMNRRHSRTCKDFYIALEVCDFHTFRDLKQSGTMKKAIFPMKNNLKRTGSHSCTAQREHELNHLKDYSQHPDKYETWPELKQKQPQDYCQYLLTKTFPRTNYREINPKCKPLILHYIRIRDKDGRKYQKMSVAALFCFVTKNNANIQKSQYQFIRAPGPSMCAFLTSHVQGSYKSFRITQLICEHKNTETVSYETALLNGDSGCSN